MYEKILIMGASGGLGQVLYRSLQRDGKHVLGTYLNHPQADLHPLDLRDRQATLRLCQEFQPDLLINTVAWTDVDGCERDYEQAFELNVLTTLSARLAAEASGAKLLHISTNDIFSGQAGAYQETDQPNPINHYARTKYIAEQILSDLPSVLILRFTFLSWWASGKTAFARWLVQSLQNQQPIKLFVDQFNAPVFVETLGEWLQQLWHLTGIYHLASERRSRWETGMAIAQGLGLNTHLIQPASLQVFNLPAPRPSDVSLRADKLSQATGLQTDFAAEIEKLLQAIPAELSAADKHDS